MKRRLNAFLGLPLANLCTVALFAITAPNALGGTRDAGGGDGIVISGKPYLLDLVEAGVHMNPYLSAQEAKPAIRDALEKNINLPEGLKREVIEPLARKITEIESAAPASGIYLAEAFRFFQFRVTDIGLIDIRDEDTVLGPSRVQLAVRKGSIIYLDGKLWPQLDLANKTALLTHEILYAFQPTAERDSDQSGEHPIGTALASSVKARFLNSSFYSPGWERNWEEALTLELVLLAGEGSDYSGWEGNWSESGFITNNFFKIMLLSARSQKSGKGTLKSQLVGMEKLGLQVSAPKFSSLAVFHSETHQPIGTLTAATPRASLEKFCRSSKIEGFDRGTFLFGNRMLSFKNGRIEENFNNKYLPACAECSRLEDEWRVNQNGWGLFPKVLLGYERKSLASCVKSLESLGKALN